ncbi:2-succinyl-5-enolpyruvyl-6-hydroxy-3-cyclohexene-1-carboxylic-acid synthase [Rossellomorea aquimaris]|uniref:2-succinyl-5-enolpyruvyl-6-hydroxy-3- cyclohexene-1-carboxylic-acid synthase n=1 Tax=Rossellomorea aquimaris TaxID=189382 RepID=UPI001CD572A5|nr:2-succinyl-5-enolpyruvyl-6-hydroxy-3-cyclohexene-1-carboxylic-acid synthase [Rossellomorea aquimaris]MCA1056792.1 2-succinyl-5-enolpyruvyl-6-hydroxy-3-cyclohexene-1-carboxylic-acid synthase [Rossellomorea aquimaris]
MDEHQQRLTQYLAAFIDELTANGVEEVVISPGSRSTPLALLFTHHPGVRTYINVDERSAAFFGLGIAKAKNKPVVILCTSGTAAANYYPAVVEARYAKVPLIVLTADRPHELREVGAPQAINQIDLYGKHVKWSVDMALPESTPGILKYAKASATRGVGLSLSAPAGPVHFNFPIREPLIPALEDVTFTNNQSEKRVSSGVRGLTPDMRDDLSRTLREKRDGLIICGPGLDPSALESITDFSEHYGFPIIADPLSQVRSGSHPKDGVIETYDAFLKVKEVNEELHPELIIRFGAMPVSKPLTLFLKGLKDIPHWVVSSGEEWQDPIARATEFIYCDERSFCMDLQTGAGINHEEKEWMNKWKSVNDSSRRILKDGDQPWNEGKAVKQLIEHLPDGASIFASNSMPIRYIDTYFFNSEKSVSVYANRGANGIDGVVSTALGMSTVQAPIYLLIGDLAFFHDLNGLLAAKKYNLDMTIVVMNNNGGGIFSYLPQASDGTHFEELFGTPMDLDFSSAAAFYGASYTLVKEEEEYSEALKHAEGQKGINIIEVLTNREENVAIHRKMWNFVSQEILKGNL